ncbi:hypothetical protein HDU79_000908 [Rhizoclosmatium sp. JEL0117]|nr:hypothetical protein HDU79_000908 [Rhizoclosmatium sp. JEL0117]
MSTDASSTIPPAPTYPITRPEAVANNDKPGHHHHHHPTSRSHTLNSTTAFTAPSSTTTFLVSDAGLLNQRVPDPTIHTETTPSIFPSLNLDDKHELEEAADVLGIDSPNNVQKVMKEMGISPWAAVLAVGSSVAAPFADVRSETVKDAGTVETGFTPRRSKTGKLFKQGLSVESDATSNTCSLGNMRVKRQFILKLARYFHQYGCPSHRFEYHMEQVSKKLNVKAEFSLLPSLIMVSFEDENGDSNTQLIKVSGGINMGKLAQVNALCLTLTQGLIDCREAHEMLDAIRAKRDYSDMLIQVTYPMCGFGVALLLFNLTWLEAGISAFLGLILGVVSILSEKYSGFGYLFEFFGSLIATFVARSMQAPLHNYCFDYVKVTLSSLAVFVPGLSLTIAIIELSTKNIVSGTVRLIGALFTSMLYGFGMTLGSALVLWDNTSPTNPTCEPTSPLWAILFLIPLAMSVNVIFQSNRHQWPIMTLASALGYAAYQFFNTIPSLSAQPTAVTALAGLVIGLTGNIYSRLTNDVAVAPIFSAIMLQVPGALSVKSTLGLFVGNGSTPSHGIDGVSFTFSMLTIGMSLSMGLFISTMLVWPISGPKSKFLAI